MDHEELGHEEHGNIWPSGTIAESIGTWMVEVRGDKPHKVAAKIMEAVGMVRGTVYRRMRNDPPFSESEIRQMAEKFGTTYEELSTYRKGKAAEAKANPKPPPMDVDAQHELPCTLHPELDLSELTAYFTTAGDDDKESGLVAVHIGSGWELMHPSQVPKNAQPRRVASIRLRKVGNRIALVEDNQDLADTLAESLRTAGLKPVHFSSYSSFMESQRDSVPFDAYVFDWFLGHKDASTPINLVRTQYPEVPIYIVSGRIDELGTQSMADFCMEKNIEFLNKPFSNNMLIQQIKRALSGSA